MSKMYMFAIGSGSQTSSSSIHLVTRSTRSTGEKEYGGGQAPHLVPPKGHLVLEDVLKRGAAAMLWHSYNTNIVALPELRLRLPGHGRFRETHLLTPLRQLAVAVVLVALDD